MLKNAIQKVHVYAYDAMTGTPKTGDALNITGYVSLDGTANAIDDTNPAEVDATNMPGVYVFDLTAAETNCNAWALYAKSSTANIRIEPIIGFTTAGTATALDANAIQVSSATTAADTLELFAEALKQDSGQIDDGTFAAGAINAAAVADGAIDAATFAADVDAEILSYLVDDATRIDASALNTAAVTSVPAILEDTGTTLPATLATIAGYLDTEIAAILADTGTDGVVLSAATANQIADAILKRDWSSVTGEAARSVLNALRLLRNKVSESGGTLTVTKEDDAATAWTAAVTTDAAASPITAIDPA